MPDTVTLFLDCINKIYLLQCSLEHILLYFSSDSLIQNVMQNKTIGMFANYSNKSSRADHKAFLRFLKITNLSIKSKHTALSNHFNNKLMYISDRFIAILCK